MGHPAQQSGRRRPRPWLQRESWRVWLLLASALILAFVVLLIVAPAAERGFYLVKKARNLWRDLHRKRLDQRHRRQKQLCDHGDWKGLFGRVRQKHIRHCMHIDLSLLHDPLGDSGVALLTETLSGINFLKHNDRTRQPEKNLRKLKLENSEITSTGAAYLARWIAKEPRGPNSKSLPPMKHGNWSDTPVVLRIPTAIVGPFELHLQGNPILGRGRRQLERAVYTAMGHGLNVVVFGGGGFDAPRQNSLKLGPLEMTLGGRKITKEDMEEWRIPPKAIDDIKEYRNDTLLLLLGGVLGLILGVVMPKLLPTFLKYLLPAVKWLKSAIDEQIQENERTTARAAVFAGKSFAAAAAAAAAGGD